MKIITVIASFLFIALATFLSSDLFLIRGSDVIEFSYSVPLWFSLVSYTSLAFCIVLRIFFIKTNKLYPLIALLIALSVYSSQVLVISGKKNTNFLYVFGTQINSLQFDPTGEYDTYSHTFGTTTIKNTYGELVFISGFCPICIKVK